MFGDSILVAPKLRGVKYTYMKYPDFNRFDDQKYLISFYLPHSDIWYDFNTKL
jgi:hypothetical protein